MATPLDFVNEKIKMMGHSLVKLYVHIVFSTKYRNPLITDEIKDELFRYLGGICRELECTPLIVGGYSYSLSVIQKNNIG